jgi:hypothetical protein
MPREYQPTTPKPPGFHHRDLSQFARATCRLKLSCGKGLTTCPADYPKTAITPLPGTKRWDAKAIDFALDAMSGLQLRTETSALDEWKARRERRSEGPMALRRKVSQRQVPRSCKQDDRPRAREVAPGLLLVNPIRLQSTSRMEAQIAEWTSQKRTTP